MRLLPVGVLAPSDPEDGLWVERPGYPPVDASWIHPPRPGYGVPEFDFDENHIDVRNEPGPVFYIGIGGDCHVRLEGALPERACRISKEGQSWLLEALLPGGSVHHRGEALDVARRVRLADGDELSLLPPPTPFAFRIGLPPPRDAVDPGYHPNKFPSKFPSRSSLAAGPSAPDELRRLAWQTDQMRRRSEEDLVKVSDWSSFSQYVKREYARHGITAVSWLEVGRQRPIDPKPPSLAPQPLPAWVAELLATERQLSGLDASREPPFASCLRLSGPCAAEPTQAQAQAGGGHDPRLRQPLAAWLQVLDETGYLMQYHDRLASRFGSLQELHDAYFRNGALDAAFFEDVGVRKLGHRRMFERWFRDLVDVR